MFVSKTCLFSYFSLWIFMKVKVKWPSHVWLLTTPWNVALQIPHPWGFPGKNMGVGCHFLSQRAFTTQGLNSGLTHCKQTLPSDPPGKPKYSIDINIVEFYIWKIFATEDKLRNYRYTYLYTNIYVYIHIHLWTHTHAHICLMSALCGY